MTIDQILNEVITQGHGDALALVMESGRTITYGRLDAQVTEASRALRDAGLLPGHRVVLVGENSEDMVIALLAVIRAGGWAVPLNARMSGGEIDAVCQHCDPRLVYYAASASADAAAHADRRGATGLLPALQSGMFEEGRGQRVQAEDDAGGWVGKVALMIYTSGSTGTPKGVMLTHANLEFITRVSAQQGMLVAGDVLFHALPISHSFGLITALLCGLRAGATIRLMPRFSAAVLGAAIRNGDVTVFMGVPAMYARLHEWATQAGEALTPNRLRLTYIGGSLIDRKRKVETETLLGLSLHHGYGLTESAPAATRTVGHPPPQDLTAGWPIPGVEVSLRDADSNAVAQGERGEVWIRGANVMKGYFRDPEQTRVTVDADGWLHTGDVGVFGPDGDLSIVGRSKEMIIRGGFNVYPAEVEKAIIEFANIVQCAVVGRSVAGDEEIVAYIEASPGVQIDLAQLRSFLRGRLAPYKLPSDIQCMDRLPASSTGKLLKARLKALANAPSNASTGAPACRPLPLPSLESLLSPQSVAVVGASDNPNKVGGRPVRYLLDQGFQGRIYAVNPRTDRVQGLLSVASLTALPEVPDVVILCVGNEQVEAQLQLCVQLGVRHVLLFASGYAEVGAPGHAAQARLAAMCRAGGVRLVGPNSIGVASFQSGAVLSFASIYGDFAPQDGPVAIVSQSGAFGVSTYALLRESGCGVRYVAATGNEADADTADFIEAFARQPGIRVILLYVENVPDAGRMTAALECARKNGVAVIAVRAGRSRDGRRAAQLHTGSSGSISRALDDLFADAGCRTVEGVAEMAANVPLYLARSDGGRECTDAPRLALISNSGASCVLAADEAAHLGCELARLSEASQIRLSALLPVFSLNRNPVDLTAMLLSDPALLGAVMDVVMTDGAVDMVVLGLIAIGGSSYDVHRFATECGEIMRRIGKPLVTYSPHLRVRQAFLHEGIAVFNGEADALAALHGYASHQARLRGLLPWRDAAASKSLPPIKEVRHA